MQPTALFWHRRDLRIHDNHGLFQALAEQEAVLPVFIFDSDILTALEETDDPRVTFIHHEVTSIQSTLRSYGSELRAHYGKPVQVMMRFLEEFPDIKTVFTNKDYEPYARERDSQVASLLKARNIEFKAYKDHVVFEEKEIVTPSGSPYTVYTPYSRAWRARFKPEMSEPFESGNLKHKFAKNVRQMPIPTLQEMNFHSKEGFHFPSRNIRQAVLDKYGDNRNFPGTEGTTKIGLHLRFGTVSVRQMVQAGLEYSDKWLSELIWRDFYAQVLANNPRLEKESFRKEFDRIKWRNNEEEYRAWCEGRTGYPLVDAGMRQLNQEYWMHNRVRMVVASFLVKHLLTDYRWGEAYFARKLLDFDLSANNGSWQWAAGSGVDAAPYFRIFNPALQIEKFDKDFEYVKRYVPEFGTPDYPKPIVDHVVARGRFLEEANKAIKGQ